MIVIFCVLLFVFLFRYFYKNYNSRRKTPHEYSFLLSLNNSPVTINQINVGDSFSTWLKPDTNQINIYYPGYYLGEGYIGRIFSTQLYNLLSSKDHVVNNCVTKIKGERIFLNFNSELIDYEAIRLMEIESTNKFIENLKNKYKPKLPFIIIYRINFYKKFPSSFIINHKDLDQILLEINYNDKYDVLSQSFWIEDNEHTILTSVNKTSKESLIKLFRVLKSGHKIDISLKSKIPKKCSDKVLNLDIEWLVTVSKNE